MGSDLDAIKREILRQIQEKRISATEGLRLIQGLHFGSAASASSRVVPPPSGEPIGVVTPLAKQVAVPVERRVGGAGVRPVPRGVTFPPVTAAPVGAGGITPATLGSAEFRRDYHLRFAYLAGSMQHGVSSREMVLRLARAGLMGFLGSAGMLLTELEEAIASLGGELKNGEPYGVNLSSALDRSEEERVVDLLLKYRVPVVEASSFLAVTPALVRYRAHGLKRGPEGTVLTANRIIAKVSRPDVVELFLRPAPERVVEALVAKGAIEREQGELLAKVPVADDICVEADSGGVSDAGVAYALIPAMLAVRDQMMKSYGYLKTIRVGAAAGIGTPEAAAAAFVQGADFIMTGSINQCTVEARTSAVVKDRLQQMNVQDTAYAPAGELFELGGRVQVLKKGCFFPARANRLHELYRYHNSLEEIDPKTRRELEEQYFKREIDDVMAEILLLLPPEEGARVEQDPKQKMAALFKWYLNRGAYLALEGAPGEEVNYQIPCDTALGAFNQRVKGTWLEQWRNRHVDDLGLMLMQETADLLNERFKRLTSG